MPAHIRTCVQFLAAALILPLLFLSPSHPQSNQSASLFHEDVLAELTPGAEAKQILVADHHLAWVEKLGDKRSVRLDGKQLGGSFDDIKYLQFSRDESRLVFFGKHSRAWYFVDDGKEDSKAISSPTGVAFQPDGPSLAYGECSEHTCRVVIDGKESDAEYDNISRYAADSTNRARRLASVRQDGHFHRRRDFSCIASQLSASPHASKNFFCFNRCARLCPAVLQ